VHSVVEMVFAVSSNFLLRRPNSIPFTLFITTDQISLISQPLYGLV